MNFTSFYVAFHDPIWVTLLSIALFFPVRQFDMGFYMLEKNKKHNNQFQKKKKLY